VTYGLNDRSRMSWEVHVRFSEGPRVKFPRSTHPWKSGCIPAPERGGISKNFDILPLAKMGASIRGSVWLMGWWDRSKRF